MNIRRKAIIATAAGALSLFAHPAFAQLPGGIGGATQAANSARVKSQVQQRVQAQIQQQVRAQAQARLQAEAARAANIATRAAALARRQAEAAKQRAAGGARVEASANASARSQARVANQSASANAHAQLGIQAGIILPPEVTKADVEIYDRIFGRFNPLRPQPAPERSAEPEPQDPSANRGAPPNRVAAVARLGARGEVDFASRVVVAARQRRAEISQIRDRALATSDAKLLLAAEEMETAMDAFVEAQARARAQAARRGDIAPRDVTSRIRAQGKLDARGGASSSLGPRTASRVGAAANGSAGAAANATGGSNP